MTIHQSIDDIVILTRDNIDRVLRGLPWRARTVLRRLTGMSKGVLDLTLPTGQRLRITGREIGPHADLKLNNWRLPARALTGGTVGAAESYMDGDWDSRDVTSFLELFLVNSSHGLDMTRGSALSKAIDKIRHWMNANTKRGSKKNISAHYDLGNAFYSQWLDETMTYSSAFYGSGANTLEGAQIAKYKALADAIGLERGHHVLEIGCGWGGFAEYAAGTVGAKVTCLTISREQHDFAVARMQRLGLSGHVDVKFQDYRDETGVYDRIASIEMFEAVGEKYWPTFFNTVRDSLRPGGKAGLQIITINDGDFDYYRSKPDFIQRYIFPGGMLPSPEALDRVTRDSGLALTGMVAFPQDYARTLAEWRERFGKAWPTIAPLGFDARFKRLWDFYLYYCEAGFRSEYIDVRQVVYARA
ncbi:MAG: cyclopropane-fatty-acyl-phospholipid synthase family protein [Rhizobiaceae bacterium]|jgi:cyclopropane-fatty-acyl-phospholipid synthase|nr:cyclopropane-fatty-acyl-phospholipid synthase family protein [Rhizobiaceae bacterium]